MRAAPADSERFDASNRVLHLRGAVGQGNLSPEALEGRLGRFYALAAWASIPKWKSMPAASAFCRSASVWLALTATILAGLRFDFLQDLPLAFPDNFLQAFDALGILLGSRLTT